MVPLDARLERPARAWIASKDATLRTAGVGALRYFKSRDNAALLRKLLNDPSTAQMGDSQPPLYQPHTWEYRNVRRSAREVLDEWGFGWEAPRVPPADLGKLIQIPAGEFTMGTDDRHFVGEEASPPRKVFLDDFWIGKYPVTVGEFRAYCKATGARYDWKARRPRFGWKEDHPMVNVTWHEARAYCQWKGGDLPTEAQWEKAARGTDGRIYPWGNSFDIAKLHAQQQTYLSDFSETAPVGRYPSGASPYGALDMVGNVAVWCLDGAGPVVEASRNPFRAPEGTRRALRGGGWVVGSATAFVAARRRSYMADGRDSDLGFRLAATKPPTQQTAVRALRSVQP
jgi:formylglycine-generating enzyme